MPVPSLLRPGLCLVLLGLAAFVTAPPSPAQSARAPSAPQTQTAAPSSADSAHTQASTRPAEDPFDVIFEFIVLGVVALLLLAIAGTFIGGFAAVSIFMETGCLRFVVFGLGWLPACFAGFLLGIGLSELIGWGYLTKLGAYTGLWGYPFGWAWGLRRAKQLPREEYVTWQRTLTGGALLGAGAGSVLNLARSATVLFKGGGGSFGGGGASGSFGSIQASGGGSAGAAGTSASSGASAGSAAVLGATSGSAARSTATQAAAEHSGEGSWIRRRIQGALRWMRRLRWYHGCAFVLVVLIFVPVGLGAAAWLQDPKTLIFVAALALAMSIYRWLKRRAEPSGAASPPGDNETSFRGGATSATW